MSEERSEKYRRSEEAEAFGSLVTGARKGGEYVIFHFLGIFTKLQIFLFVLV